MIDVRPQQVIIIQNNLHDGIDNIGATESLITNQRLYFNLILSKTTQILVANKIRRQEENICVGEYLVKGHNRCVESASTQVKTEKELKYRSRWRY